MRMKRVIASASDYTDVSLRSLYRHGKLQGGQSRVSLVCILTTLIIVTNVIWLGFSLYSPTAVASYFTVSPPINDLPRSFQKELWTRKKGISSSLMPKPPGSPASPSSSSTSLVGLSVCDGCDQDLADRLNSRFHFHILNLDRRRDRLACVQKHFYKYGIYTTRLPGVDAAGLDPAQSTLLPQQLKDWLKSDKGQKGHVGCMYGHLQFLLKSAERERRCVRLPEQGGPVRTQPGSTKSVSVSFQNKMIGEAQAYWVDEYGAEHFEGSIPPKSIRTFESVLLHAWRVKVGRLVITEFKLMPDYSSNVYEMSDDMTSAKVELYNCEVDGTEVYTDDRVNILFEDDVVLQKNFGERLVWLFEELDKYAASWKASEGAKSHPASSLKRDDGWDVMLLNWYCNNGHWKACNNNGGVKPIVTSPFTLEEKDAYDYASNLDGISLTEVKFFMSGGGYAVSPSGAERILLTFPCDNYARGGECSPAVDYHYSALIDGPAKLRVFGAAPPIVLMPDMSGVPPMDIGVPPREKTLGCGGEYVSDTHVEGRYSMHAPKRIDMEMEAFKRHHASKQGGGQKGGRFVALHRYSTWADAHSTCLRLREDPHLDKIGVDVSEITSPNLATITSEEENTAAKELAEKTCGHVTSNLNGWDLCAWTGLNDVKKEGQFEWVDGSISSYRNFYDGEPNNQNDEDYVGACWYLRGKWADFGATFELPCILCEIEPPSSGK